MRNPLPPRVLGSSQDSESINDPGEQQIWQLSGARYFVVFQAWAFFSSPDLLTLSKGEWKYLYHAVDHEGQTIDFLLTPHRDTAAAEAFLHKAIRTQGLPERVTIDQSGSNTAAIHHCNKIHKTAIVIRHSKYLNKD